MLSCSTVYVLNSQLLAAGVDLLCAMAKLFVFTFEPIIVGNSLRWVCLQLYPSSSAAA